MKTLLEFLRRRRKELTISALEVTGILVAHHVLLRVMWGSEMIARVFAAGPHLAFSDKALILVFLFVRLMFLLLPGFLLARICWLFYSKPESQEAASMLTDR